MLSPAQISWIKRLAAEGRSLRQIAQATGLARATVRKVVEPKQDLALIDTIYDVDEPFFTDRPRHCPDCGGFCYMPCLKCYLQKLQQEKSS